jgi:hypothetical protein
MDAELGAQLARLVRKRRTAALGTLRAGAPFVSMVPYALAPDGAGFIVHVSELSAHTKDMLADAHVGLMIAGSEDGDESPLALARVSVQGLAQRIASGAPERAGLKAAYLARFPDAEPMFGFADFALFLIRPESARFVAGFGQAHSLSGASMMRLLQQG